MVLLATWMVVSSRFLESQILTSTMELCQVCFCILYYFIESMPIACVAWCSAVGVRSSG